MTDENLLYKISKSIGNLEGMMKNVRDDQRELKDDFKVHKSAMWKRIDENRSSINKGKGIIYTITGLSAIIAGYYKVIEYVKSLKG